jgi:hypothetical protein
MTIYVAKGKASPLLMSFIAFCNDYPDLRFWQALCSWSGKIIYAQGMGLAEDAEVVDTFYWTEKTK